MIYFGKFDALAPADPDFAVASNKGITAWISNDDTLCYILFEGRINDGNINKFWPVISKKYNMKQNGTDGDLLIFDVKNKTLGTDGVGLYEDGKVLIITGENLDELKKIGKSVKFKK